ncbi:hypothetical protein [Metabacillus litoralis]|uniref:hypothetical protein n=1 Tax=Metabacillus litoralis TaxID=152268 RepID=UPI00203EC001|nr:hypothetical protein [Metabacillus litoralis]MCM3411490.1 hypothetical protein [Metabacillus litoralis]
MGLGKAGTIAVVQISGTDIENGVNLWLESHPEVEVIDIKFSASATHEDWGSDALVIYRKEVKINAD